MASKKQPIGGGPRLDRSMLLDFDDQPWPIHVAIFLLAGFAGWVLLATTPQFNDPRLLYNGYVRLGSVVLMIGLLFWAVTWLQGRLRRRIILCVLISLLIHLGLALYLHEHYMVAFSSPQKATVAQLAEPAEPIAKPDFRWENVQPTPLEEKQELEKPVETQPPEEPKAEPLRLEAAELPAAKPESVAPETPQPKPPEAAQVRRAELSAPRREETAGKQLSREPWQARPLAYEPVSSPAIKPEGRPSPAALQDQVAAVQRRDTELARQRKQFDEAPPSIQPREPLRMARRAALAERPLEAPPKPATLRRHDAEARMARAQAAAPQPVPPTRDTTGALEPVAVAPGRQIALPGSPSTPEAAAAVSAAVTKATVRQRRQESQPEPVAAAQAAARRPARLAEAPAEAEPAPHVARVFEQPADLEAAEPRAQRQMAAAALPILRAEPNEAASEQRRAGPAVPQPRRADPIASGQSAWQAAGAAPLARQGAAAGIAPAMIPGSAAPAPAGERALGIEAPMVALSRASTVPAWVGLGAMPDGASAAFGGPARLPASLARRETASQQDSSGRGASAGPALALARAPGGAPLPSGRAEGEARAAPPAAGEREFAFGSEAAHGRPEPPSGIEVGVDLGVVRASAAATLGPGTAPAGATATGGGMGVVLGLASPRRTPSDGILTLDGHGAGGLHRRSSSLGALPSGEAGAPGLMAAPKDASGETPGQPDTLERSSLLGQGRSSAGVVRGVDGVPGVRTGEGEDTARDSQAARVRVARPSRANRGDRGGTGETLGAAGSGLARSPSPKPTVEAAAEVGAPGAARPASSGGTEQTVEVSLSPGDTSVGPQGPGFADQPAIEGVGGTASDTAAFGSAALRPGGVAGPRRAPADGAGEPSLAANGGGTPLRKANNPGLVPGMAEAGQPAPAGVGTAAAGEPGRIDIGVSTDVGGPAPQPGGLPVLIAALEGPGGLRTDRSAYAGIPSRLARPESDVVHTVPRRFLVERSGGRWALDGRSHEVAAEGFQQRNPSLRGEIAKQRGGGETTERAVERGLDFLARHQFPDGRWSLDRVAGGGEAALRDFAPGQMNCDSAATGLALLSFLGAGYTHRDDKHRNTVRRGLDWLMGNQQPNGQLFTRETDATLPARIYGHGIATIALCEAYGMTRDPALRAPAQKAIGFILEAQDPQGGGWRYTQPDDAPTWLKESDTSVSGWQLMALKSAQMAGLEVPLEALEKVGRWLDASQAQGGALYVYNPNAATTPDQIQGRSPNLPMTAEGLLMRLYLGAGRDNPAMIEGAEYLKAHLPELGSADRPLRDGYYWYYATQVMFQMQGDYWTAWNDRMRSILEASQVTEGPLAGSWHPAEPVRDRWAHAGGRLYVTALNLLMFEVYYRHLPLFQTLAK